MKLFALLALAGALWAQAPSQTVKSAPDCVLSFTFSTSTTSASLDNRFKLCNTWVISYASTGWTAVDVTLQSAPDAGATPGTWATFTGTVVSGSNPVSGDTYNTAAFVGFVPWARVTATVTGISGTVRGTLLGWASRPSPVLTATGCVNQAAITLTGAGDTEIIAATTGRAVRICELYLAAASAEDVKLTQGTGTNCGVGTANITGLFRQITALNINSGNGIRGATGKAICVNQSGGINSGGIVIYALE